MSRWSRSSTNRNFGADIGTPTSALYVVGCLTLFLALITALAPIAVLPLVYAIEGALLLAFGYLTMRGSLLALGIATGLYTLEGLLLAAGGRYQGIVLRVLILFFLIQGFRALRELKRRQTPGTTEPEPSVPRPERPTTS